MIYQAIDLWNSPDPYLEHYGVKGMKWGVRKQEYKERIRAARQNKRQANRNYNRAYSKAYNFSSLHPITQHIKKNKNYAKSNDLWNDAADKANAANIASEELKKAKLDYKEAKIKNKIEKSNYKIDKWSKGEGTIDLSGIKKSKEKVTDFVKNHKKQIAVGAAVVAGVGLAAYGGYRLNSIRQSNMAAVGKYISDNGIKLGDHIIDAQTAPTSSKIPYRTISRRNATISKSIFGPRLDVYDRTWHSMPGVTVDDHGKVGLSNTRSSDWITGDVKTIGGDRYAYNTRSQNKGDAKRRRRAAIRVYKAVAKEYK